MPPPPQIKEGYFNIYFEEIDSFVAGLAIPPTCYMCEEQLDSGETVVTIRIRGMPNRYCLGCYDQLAIGLSLFNRNYDKMKVHSSGLQ